MILRHKHERDYLVVPNALVRDQRLKLRDVGLLVYMLSLPDNWDFSVAGLLAILPGVGRDGLRDSLRRLEDAGYLRREQMRGKDGKITGEVWIVTDEPETAFPATAKPATANPTQRKNLTNKLHTERKKREISDERDSGVCEQFTSKSGQVYTIHYDA